MKSRKKSCSQLLRVMMTFHLIVLGAVLPSISSPNSTLPTLGDPSDLTTSAERRLGDRIIRELYLSLIHI